MNMVAVVLSPTVQALAIVAGACFLCSRRVIVTPIYAHRRQREWIRQ